jgi:hypothetical protein
MLRGLMSFVVVAGLAAFAAGCSNTTTTPSGPVSTITVTGSVPAVGASSQFTATALLSDGTVQNVTTAATWSTSNATFATVSSGGLVTGLAGGTVTITAVDQGVSGSMTFVP